MQERGFLVLDFGSQFTQLITRRLREMGYYSEIHRPDLPQEEIDRMSPYGVILSGGPNSVYDINAPKRDVRALISRYPTLGICYGMQLIAQELGGEVRPGHSREYGLNIVEWSEPPKGIPKTQKVWMSHG
ncbi:MAG: GMP synthase (glutamine-hydrolyzing), partial [Bdellovibrionaceae bacterium]|nr:GMP synthase (glutamine-hydrolyzing) [Pseudobdellovibrionaceae bacterium]